MEEEETLCERERVCVSLLVKGRMEGNRNTYAKGMRCRNEIYTTRKYMQDSRQLRQLLAERMHRKKCGHARLALTRLTRMTVNNTTRMTKMDMSTSMNMSMRRKQRGNHKDTHAEKMMMLMTNVLVNRDEIAAERGLRGGGGDGGTTGAESRSTYLDMYKEKKKDKADKETALLNTRRSCALSGAMLQAEACVDAAGQLINKEELIRRMLDGSLKRMPKFGHLRSLKDVEDAKLIRQPRGQCAAAAAAAAAAAPRDVHSTATTTTTTVDRKQPDGSETGFCCPVLGTPLDTRAGFVLLRGTGMVVSEKALRQAKEVIEDMTGVKIDGSRVLKLFPTEDEVAEVRATIMEARKAKSEKKQKRHKQLIKKSDTVISVADADGVVIAAAGLKRKNGGEEEKLRDDTTTAGGVRADVSIQKDKVDSEGVMMSQDKPKKMKSSKSVPRGGVQGSDVYKSIFSSSHASADKDGDESFCARNVSARGFALH